MESVRQTIENGKQTLNNGKSTIIDKGMVNETLTTSGVWAYKMKLKKFDKDRQ